MNNKTTGYMMIILPFFQPKPNYGTKYKTEKGLHSTASKEAKL